MLAPTNPRLDFLVRLLAHMNGPIRARERAGTLNFDYYRSHCGTRHCIAGDMADSDEWPEFGWDPDPEIDRPIHVESGELLDWWVHENVHTALFDIFGQEHEGGDLTTRIARVEKLIAEVQAEVGA